MRLTNRMQFMQPNCALISWSDFLSVATFLVPSFLRAAISLPALISGIYIARMRAHDGQQSRSSLNVHQKCHGSRTNTNNGLGTVDNWVWGFQLKELLRSISDWLNQCRLVIWFNVWSQGCQHWFFSTVWRVSLGLLPTQTEIQVQASFCCSQIRILLWIIDTGRGLWRKGCKIALEILS